MPSPNHEFIVKSVLDACQEQYESGRYGPFALLVPRSWLTFMDEQYGPRTRGISLANRLRQLPNVQHLMMNETDILELIPAPPLGVIYVYQGQP